jgi:3'-phosphoadenosine 5'-phosphosulfate sulfotransferase (PAPS reductase)/FAD synthetase
MVHRSQVSFSELATASSIGEGRATVVPRRLNQLRALEAESIDILRETAAEFARPMMLYSSGKDSWVRMRLAQKAFFPAKIPFPLLHIDTSYKFPKMTPFRDTYARQSQPYFTKQFLAFVLSKEVVRPLLVLRAVIRPRPCC